MTASISARNCSRRVTFPFWLQAIPANVRCSAILNLPTPSLDVHAFYHVERLTQSFPSSVTARPSLLFLRRTTASERHEEVARRRVREPRHAGHPVAQIGERGRAARTDVDQDRVEGEAEPALLATEVLEPRGRDLALAIGDQHDVAAPVARRGQRGERGVERHLEIRPAARKVFGDVEGALVAHQVVVARVQVEGEEGSVRRREADEAEQPALAARDLEEGQRDGLRPDLLLARHRGRAVEADDHRAASALVRAPETVAEQLSFRVTAQEVAPERWMPEREQLRRQQAIERTTQLDVERLLARALEAAPS